MTLQPLLEILNKLQEAHEALLELARDKTQILVRNEIDLLNKIVSKESRLLRAIAETDQLRLQAIAEYLISRGYNPDPRITISDLVRVVFKAEDKQALAGAQRKLMGIIHQLKELNGLNQQLIEQSLAFINYSIDLVVGPSEDDVIYRNPQQAGLYKKANSFFDSRA